MKPLRKALGSSVWLRATVTAGALAWTLSRVSIAEVSRALGSLSLSAIAGALALTTTAVALGALRWRLVLEVFRPHRSPKMGFVLRGYFIGMFYNTFLPANVAGDVLRAHCTRGAFDAPSKAYGAVFYERTLGLLALIAVASLGLSSQPLQGAPWTQWLGPLGLLAAVVLVLALANLASFIHLLPTVLRKRLSFVPERGRGSRWLAAFLASITSHAVAAVAGHLLLSSLHPTLALSTSLQRVPVALAAAYAPTVAGLGTREAAFVVLFSASHVTQASATAASLGLFACQLLVSMGGGAWHLIRPLAAPPSSEGS